MMNPDPQGVPAKRGRRSGRRLTRGRKLLYRIAIPLCAWVMRGYWSLCRIRIIDAALLDARLQRHEPSILCYWHRHQLFCWPYIRSRIRRGARIGWLISGSVDGEVPSGVARAIGGGIIFRGSTTSGGAEALRAMYRAVRRDGTSIAATPDGPRGPAEVFKVGMVKLAQLSGAPLVPIAWAARRVWTFRSWDRFVLPKPFTTLVLAIGSPTFVPRDATDAEIEAIRAATEQSLRALFLQAREALP